MTELKFKEMDNSTDEVLRSIAQSLTTLQQISSAALSLGSSLPFTRPLQRKLESLVKCNVHDAQGPSVAMRLALTLAERAVSDLTVPLQAQQHEKISLWTAIRSHGCQFLGPAITQLVCLSYIVPLQDFYSQTLSALANMMLSVIANEYITSVSKTMYDSIINCWADGFAQKSMQEEVLKLILLALEDGSSLSRKVLVLFVVQRLHLQFPQASKTSVGHVVQLLYRASCFNVIKRDEESSLMQLKEEFRNYEELRCQHDMQIVEISRDFGLRIGPEQWSCLLYGDNNHRSHMQSVIDKVLKRQTLLRSTEELMAILQKSGDPLDLSVELQPLLDLLVDLQKNTSLKSTAVSLSPLDSCLKAVVKVISALSRSLQLKQTWKTDRSPALSNCQAETGGYQSSGEIKVTAVAALDSFSSPINSSCSPCCTDLQCSSSSVVAEDGYYRLLSPGCPGGVAPSPHVGYSLRESLPFRTSTQPPFFSPPLNVIANERVCTPLRGGYCPSPVLVSVHNLPGPSEFFQPVHWYPTADDYNQCAVLLNTPSTSNHVSN